MNFAAITNQVAKIYKVTKQDAQTISFESGENLFHIAVNSTGFDIYQAYEDEDGYNLLPGYKTAKTFKAVQKFVELRA